MAVTVSDQARPRPGCSVIAAVWRDAELLARYVSVRIAELAENFQAGWLCVCRMSSWVGRTVAPGTGRLMYVGCHLTCASMSLSGIADVYSEYRHHTPHRCSLLDFAKRNRCASRTSFG